MPRLWVGANNFFAVQVDAAGIRAIQAAHNIQEGGLPALARAENHQKLVFDHREIDVPQYFGDRATHAGKRLADVMGCDLGLRFPAVGVIYIDISRFHGQILFSAYLRSMAIPAPIAPISNIPVMIIAGLLISMPSRMR